MTKSSSVIKTAKHPVSVGAIALALLGGGTAGGYKVITENLFAPILVKQTATNAKLDQLYDQQEELIHYMKLFVKLNFREEDVKAAKKEIAAEEYWD